jgi:putative phosphoesterase
MSEGSVSGTIFVISDTHLPVRARDYPEAFLRLLSNQDVVLHAGDHVTLDSLRRLESFARVYAVSGNMDNYELRKVLPKKRIIELQGCKIGLFHGYGVPWGLPSRVRNEFTDEKGLDVIVFGHSHSPYNKMHGSTILFNPGSLSGNLFGGKSYGILHIGDDKIQGEIVKL